MTRLREIVEAEPLLYEVGAPSDYSTPQDFAQDVAERVARRVLEEACIAALTNRHGYVQEHSLAVDRIKQHFGLGDGDGE